MMKTEIELIPIPPLPLKSDIVRTIRMTYSSGQFYRIQSNEIVLLKDGDFIHTVEVSYRVVIRSNQPEPKTSSNEIFPTKKSDFIASLPYADGNTFFSQPIPKKKYNQNESLLPTEKKSGIDPLHFLKKSTAISQNLQQHFPFPSFNKTRDEHEN